MGSAIGGVLRAAVDLVLSRTCAGCGSPDVGLCPGCRLELADLALDDLGPLAPRPVPPGWPGCHGTLRYDGVASRLATAFKDEGRRDLAAPMGALLADAVARALATTSPSAGLPVLLVPVPSSRVAIRRRGDQPMLLLARRAARVVGPTVQVATALTTVRRTADQAGLDQASRRANLHGAMRVTDPRRVRGRHVLVVDDVLTSGATLAEAHRAVLAAGAADVCLAVAMVTPRRSSAVHLSFRARSD